MTIFENAFAKANAAYITAQSDYLVAAEKAANNPTDRNWAAADKAFQAQWVASEDASKAAQAMHNEAFAAAHA